MNATYHLTDPRVESRTLKVLKKNDDGTVDLGDVETGELKVGSCPVSESPKNGCCVIGEIKLPAPAPEVEAPKSEPAPAAKAEKPKSKKGK